MRCSLLRTHDFKQRFFRHRPASPDDPVITDCDYWMPRRSPSSGRAIARTRWRGMTSRRQRFAGRCLGQAPVRLSFLSFPGQAGGAERRKTHRENMHRTRPDGLTSPGSQAACVSSIVAKDADNAHARRRSTRGDFLPRSRTSGDWTGLLHPLIRRLSPPSSVPRPAIEGSPS